MPSTKSIYQLKVTLKGSKPPIWRRLLVPENISLYELHAIIQIAMGWTNSHLHMFRIGEEIYGDPADDEYGDFGTKDETRSRLKKIANAEKITFRYEYDFGDSWDHTILVEKIIPAEKSTQYPVCIAGKRACPPEDVGGLWGYENFLQAIANPDHEEHDEYIEWVGGDFDPEAFDLDEVNEVLPDYKHFDEFGDMYLDEDNDVGMDKIIAWVEKLTKEQFDHFDSLALRRDMIAFLTYLAENRVTGTQSTGNLPLKAVREICAKFVNPPTLDHVVGDKTFKLRSEDDVWPLIFIHTLANVSGLVSGGPARRWQVTQEGQLFPQTPTPVQVAFLFQYWWYRVNWAICFSYSGLGGGPPAGFNHHTLACLLDLPVGKASSYEAFADHLIAKSGLYWPIPDQVSARNILGSAIASMVIEPLSTFSVMETGYTKKTKYGYTSKELDTICLTQLGKDMLELL
ncbi:MAG: plasmid pRiA4b ORF-3 family protein [Anaerolineales bacterium]|nr:plasmid pRiA4b ORF-3 family protein [Anaerolineales bacterium]